MKISKLEFVTLLLTAAFLAFLGGWFLRGNAGSGPIRVETARTLDAGDAVLTLPSPTPSTGPAAGEKININTADSALLQTLPGIGASRAAAIIAYREANGPFRIPEELTNVKGIGEGILAGLIDNITVS